jgi:hypothetical protein
LLLLPPLPFAQPLSHRTPLQAAAGQGIAAAVDKVSPAEKAGCYRLGETGYHWYRFCFGLSWLYPTVVFAGSAPAGTAETGTRM